jgi:uncharacterized protein YacL
MNFRRIILYVLLIALVSLAIGVYYTHTTQPINDESNVALYSNLFFGLVVVTLGYLVYHISLVQKDQNELRDLFNKYIRDHLKKGDTQKSIKKNLKKVGWQEEDVKKRIDKVKNHIKR